MDNSPKGGISNDKAYKLSIIVVYKEQAMKYLLSFLLLLPISVVAEITNYSCNYTSYSNSEGNHKVEDKFELNFIVDHTTGKNYLLGNAGSSEVKVLESQDRIAFLEITDTGNFMSTAIDSKLNSVHSRNTVMFGELLPSQYYGKCVIR